MPLSYRNIINGNKLADAIGSGDFSKEAFSSAINKSKSSSAKYISGYAQDSAIEALANSLNINKGLFRQVFGLEDKKIDLYDPYHTTDAKKEDFWYDSNGDSLVDGKEVQKKVDDDTNTFKRALYSEYDFRQNDFWYEDPLIPAFEIFFDDNSPLFKGDDFIDSVADKNSLKYFIKQYMSIDPTGYSNRFALWSEFSKVFFKIFEKDLKDNKNRNISNKAYFITKIAGLEFLNKKLTNYGEDKITITMNEDVSMIAWYLTELYNNIVYSYKNKRFMFPENVIRFDMTIKINEMRNFQMPQSNNPYSENVPVDKNYSGKNIKNVISPKSQIVYTLHDCTFNFFESRNYGNEIEIGGYGTGAATTPATLSFDINYKSVTRYSNFPLIKNSLKINPWETELYTTDLNNTEQGTKHNYYDNLDRISAENTTDKKGYLNKLLGKAAQTVVNQGLNYMDNLESKLRDVRGGAVNGLLTQFRSATSINKIEPDNVYNTDFNDRASIKNAGKQIASGLLNDLESTVRNAANF